MGNRGTQTDDRKGWLARVSSTQMNLDMDINNIAQQWDLVIIGGGITGAGILREATNMGLQALLVEQKDFAWGTDRKSVV